ncbi:MAG: hypothetical protein ACO4AU_11015 [bacterium]|jgi:hypothetical protein
MKHRQSMAPQGAGLDSLVDIVSNSVGILVILSVFVALLTLNAPELTTPETRTVAQEEKIVIPWSHYSQKASRLMLIKNNQVVLFDRAGVYRRIRDELAGSRQPPEVLDFPDYETRLTTLSGSAHCLDFSPYRDSGRWWHEFSRSGGELDRLLQAHRPETTYFYFWVHPNSFELFRDIRQKLWDANFEVGWKPVRDQTPLRYCSGFGEFRSFQPQ